MFYTIIYAVRLSIISSLFIIKYRGANINFYQVTSGESTFGERFDYIVKFQLKWIGLHNLQGVTLLLCAIVLI